MADKPSRLFVGLMSGTSMDGIDAVLVEDDTNHTQLLHSHQHPIPQSLKTQLTEVIEPSWKGSLSEIGQLDQQLGKIFAEAVSQLLDTYTAPHKKITAIGSHGQTVCHEPTGKHPFTMQLGDPNQIAELTGITTVADFRRMDMSAGGQGAPLVPAYHQHTFQHPEKNRVILNIGGIANITILPKENLPITGFDTGPGNGLLDAWIDHSTNQTYDSHGRYARSGKLHKDALARLLNDPFFSSPPPKSTGKEYFNLKWVKHNIGNLNNDAKNQDIQATLTELTAVSIAQSIKKAAPQTNEVLICGGGIHNKFLIERIKENLSPIEVKSTQTENVDPDWVEAIAFAWMAKRTIDKETSNIPNVTGAKSPRILGAIYQTLAN